VRFRLLVHELTPAGCLPSYQFFLPVLLACKYPMIEKQVTFLVDTGATYTSLQDKDVKRLKIQYRDLERRAEKDWAKGIAGERIETYIMEDVRLLLLSEDKKSVGWEAELPHIGVLRHPTENWEDVKEIPSLLGMDVLSQLRLVIDKTVPEAYVEVAALDGI